MSCNIEGRNQYLPHSFTTFWNMLFFIQTPPIRSTQQLSYVVFLSVGFFSLCLKCSHEIKAGFILYLHTNRRLQHAVVGKLPTHYTCCQICVRHNCKPLINGSDGWICNARYYYLLILAMRSLLDVKTNPSCCIQLLS